MLVVKAGKRCGKNVKMLNGEVFKSVNCKKEHCLKIYHKTFHLNAEKGLISPQIIKMCFLNGIGIEREKKKIKMHIILNFYLLRRSMKVRRNFDAK
jgi:hypothetical protein